MKFLMVGATASLMISISSFAMEAPVMVPERSVIEHRMDLEKLAFYKNVPHLMELTGKMYSLKEFVKAVENALRSLDLGDATPASTTCLSMLQGKKGDLLQLMLQDTQEALESLKKLDWGIPAQ